MRKTVYEYGSEFDWDANKGYLKTTNQDFLKTETAFLFRSGRDALKAVALENGGKYKKIILPALCCESMVSPFLLNGFFVDFYKMKSDFSADLEDIQLKMENNTILLYMSYFGIPSLSENELLEIKKKFNQTIFIKDCTHSVLQDDTDTFFRPEFKIASIRKWAALPAGGLLWTSKEMKIPKCTDLDFETIRKEAFINKSKYLECGDDILKENYRKMFDNANSKLDESNIPCAMTSESEGILKNIDFEKIRQKRENNVKVLKQGLKDLVKNRNILYLTQTPEKSGLYFPIFVSEQKKVQKILAQNGIYCPVIWPTPESAKGVCAISEYVASHMLAVPCDQRYDENDMKKIIIEIEKMFNG